MAHTVAFPGPVVVFQLLATKHALAQAGLHIEDGPQLWELTTQRIIGDHGQEFLSAVSIFTVPNLSFRQKALQVRNRIRPRYAEKAEPAESAPVEKDPWEDSTGKYQPKDSRVFKLACASSREKPSASLGVQTTLHVDIDLNCSPSTIRPNMGTEGRGPSNSAVVYNESFSGSLPGPPNYPLCNPKCHQVRSIWRFIEVLYCKNPNNFKHPGPRFLLQL